MPVAVSITIREDQLREVRAALDPRQYRQATFQAVLRTTNAVARDVKDQVKKRSYVQPKYIDRVIKVRKPAGEEPEGRVTVSQELLPLTAFKVKAAKGGGVTVQTAPGKTLQLAHAFVATMRSGHRGVFLRARHLPTKGPNEGKGKLTPRGIAGRFAIREQFGPSVLQVVRLPEVMEAIEADAAAALQKNVSSQLDRFLKPRGAPRPPAG